ncbi:MAG: class I SAM-dependent methyltransferase [Rhizobacter sp.]|nr:class I SAM-dependent methyltransferase [Rhizobacter sp.]
MTSSLASSARQAYWRLASFVNPGSKSPYPADYTPAEVEIIQSVDGKTLTTTERVVALVRALDYVIQNDIPGSIVECGVWKGGSMMAAALALQRLGKTNRSLYLYDTYEGMPPPTELDKDYLGNTASSQMAALDKNAMIWARAQLDEVQANMQSTGYPGELISYVKGKVEDTIPQAIPNSIALLRLDTDWYESTKHELEHLFPRLVPGGVLILDDYGHWEGARRAVDEYIDAHGIRLLLCRIDMGGRIAIKQS